MFLCPEHTLLNLKYRIKITPYCIGVPMQDDIALPTRFVISICIENINDVLVLDLTEHRLIIWRDIQDVPLSVSFP